MSRCRAIGHAFLQRFSERDKKTRIAAWRARATSKAAWSRAKIITNSFFVLDHLEPAHIGLQHVRYRDRTVLLLIGLHHRDQRAADGGAGAVQRMHEARLAVTAAIARIHPPRLEIAAHRAA